MATTPLTFSEKNVVNMALTRMGADILTSFENDTSKRAIIMRENYPLVRQNCLTKTHWRTTTDKASLNKLSATPENRWSAAWQLPADCLRVLYTWPATNYEIQGKRLYSNETGTLIIDYTRYVGEGEWFDWLTEYVVNELIVATVKGITKKDPTPAQFKNRDKAEVDAFVASSQQQPNQSPLPNPFVDCRG